MSRLFFLLGFFAFLAGCQTLPEGKLLAQIKGSYQEYLEVADYKAFMLYELRTESGGTVTLSQNGVWMNSRDSIPKLIDDLYSFCNKNKGSGHTCRLYALGNERVWTRNKPASFEPLISAYKERLGPELVAEIEQRAADKARKAADKTAYENEELARMEDELERDFIEEDSSARVTVDEASVHEYPDEKSAIKDNSFPKGSLVRIIGAIDEGPERAIAWKQLAQDGKPIGWIKSASLKMATAQNNRQDAGAIGDKPSIYIAYPRDGEEMADDHVNFVGYVTSANQTKEFSISVNRFPLSLKSLWTGSALDTQGLRGYPIELTLPLQPGDNRVELQVQDAEGFVVRKTLLIRRIEIDDSVQTAAVSGLPPRLPNIDVARNDRDVTSDNFMSVLGDWVKDTAKSDYNKGNVMLDQGRYARAAFYYHKSISTDPIGAVWFNLGISERARGNGGKAREAFTNACQLQVSEACDMAG